MFQGGRRPTLAPPPAGAHAPLLSTPFSRTISNTRATFAYYSFCDNLRLQCTLRLLSLFAVIFKLISSEKKYVTSCNEMNDNPMLLVVLLTSLLLFHNLKFTDSLWN